MLSVSCRVGPTVVGLATVRLFHCLASGSGFAPSSLWFKCSVSFSEFASTAQSKQQWDWLLAVVCLSSVVQVSLWFTIGQATCSLRVHLHSINPWRMTSQWLVCIFAFFFAPPQEQKARGKEAGRQWANCMPMADRDCPFVWLSKNSLSDPKDMKWPFHHGEVAASKVRGLLQTPPWSQPFSFKVLMWRISDT